MNARVSYLKYTFCSVKRLTANWTGVLFPAGTGISLVPTTSKPAQDPTYPMELTIISLRLRCKEFKDENSSLYGTEVENG
jgi:hypothetical protein